MNYYNKHAIEYINNTKDVNMKEYYGETIDQEEIFEDSYAVWTCEGEYEIVEIIVRIVR